MCIRERSWTETRPPSLRAAASNEAADPRLPADGRALGSADRAEEKGQFLAHTDELDVDSSLNQFPSQAFLGVGRQPTNLSCQAFHAFDIS